MLLVWDTKVRDVEGHVATLYAMRSEALTIRLK